MLAFSEGVLLAEKSGIPREKAVEVMLASVIASPMVAYRGPLVLEVNSSPGLEGIERATGVDVADRIIAYAEKNARIGVRSRAASAREVEVATALSVSDGPPEAQP